MINFTNILNDFNTLVGVRSTNGILLSESLQTSDSGLIVNSLPDVSLEVIQDASVGILKEILDCGDLIIGNYYLITDVSGSADFTIVGADSNTVGVLFEATAEEPIWGSGKLETQPVIDYLNLVRTDEIPNVLKQFVSGLQKKLQVKDLLVNDSLIHEFATTTNSQNEMARGFYFKLADSKSLQMIIKSISLHLDAIDTCRFYLYEIGKNEAIQTFDYTSKDNEINFSVLTDWIINYQSSDNSDKEYLLLYYDYDSDNIQEDIQLNSDTKFYQNSECFKSLNNNYIYFAPVEIPKSKWNWDTDNYLIPDFEDSKPLNYCTNLDNGLNIQFNINCEISQILIDNKNLFAKMLQYAMAERILNDAFVSNRSNRVKRNSNENNINYANKYMALLQGQNVETAHGIQWVGGEIDRVIHNFKNIDLKCFSDNNNNKFTITNSYQK